MNGWGRRAEMAHVFSCSFRREPVASKLNLGAPEDAMQQVSHASKN